LPRLINRDRTLIAYYAFARTVRAVLRLFSVVGLLFELRFRDVNENENHYEL